MNMIKQLASVAVVMVGLSAAPAPLLAQDASVPVLLVLDQTAIDYGDPPHGIPATAANAPLADIGLRDALPYFEARIGESVPLASGTEGNDGWFALRSTPQSWTGADGSDDGLQNFFVADAGLGSPDEAGNRTALLSNIPDVVALRAAGLNMLTGRRVCAVIFDGEVTIAADPAVGTSLAGPNLGVAAFRVTSVDASGTEWPVVTVEVLDARETCRGSLAAFAEAP